jgi:ergothioneine biosynthesis protein EgtB
VRLDDFRRAWRRSDRLFALLAEEAWLEQPIALRQPLLFYLGHLPAFAWKHLGRDLLGRAPFRPDFDALFERGIDPTDTDVYEARAAWPERGLVLAYRDRVRSELGEALSDPRFPAEGASVVALVVEHELMHHETLLYMFQELDHALKRRPPDWPPLPGPGEPGPARTVEVPAGEVVLGAAPGSVAFGWDNEFPQMRVEVEAFAIDDRPVTNAEMLAFADAGGYGRRDLWRDEDWAWRARRALTRPHSFRGAGACLAVRGVLEDVPFAAAAHWPASVSWAEAAAYARWRGVRLPTEAEWRRAAEGAKASASTNVHFRRGSPAPVASDPGGASAWGVLDLLGNGWEWTGTPFAPFPGFSPLPRYPGYSADFFDGDHFVMLGGSWATDEALLRPSFRNWFQPRYPFVFSQFRCVRSP